MTGLASFGNWTVTEKGVEYIGEHRATVPKWALYSKAVPELSAYMARGLSWLDDEELFNLQSAIRERAKYSPNRNAAKH